MKRACFLDLDGTLVRAFPEGDTTRGPRTVEEVEFLPGTKEACRLLREAGYVFPVITNQPDIARGKLSSAQYLHVQDVVYRTLGTPVFVCPHDGSWCACRKSRPGLIYYAAILSDIDLSQSWLIGDRQTDIDAAHAAGIPNTARVQTNEGILRAVRWILSHGGLHASQ